MLGKCLFAFIAVFAISTAAIADEARDQSGKARSSAAAPAAIRAGGRLHDTDSQLHLPRPGHRLHRNDLFEQIKVDQNHFKCINLCGGVPPDTGTTGIHIVITPSDKVIVHCIGGTPCF